MSQPRSVVLRISRPYETEEDFIRGDGLAIGRLGMILIGAPKRPPGITVRFEIQLQGGEAVFRGEGRVVALRVHPNGREGLEVRFTRLDSRSKALVERVVELRKSGTLVPVTMPPPASIRPSSGPDLRIPKAARLPQDVGLGAESEKAPESKKPVVPKALTPIPPSESASPEKKKLEDAGSGSMPKVQAKPSRTESSIPPKVDVIAVADERQDVPVQVVAEASDKLVEPEDVLEELEVLDEDPTPFAPPVMLAEMEESVSGEQAISERREVDTRTDDVVMDAAGDGSVEVLSKLRIRRAEYEAPASTAELLERLRERVKSL